MVNTDSSVWITLFRIELGEDINNIPNKSTDIYDIKEESDSKGKSDLTSASSLHLKKFSSFPNTWAEAYLEPSRKSTMELFCENN